MIKAVIFDWGGVIAEEKNGGWGAAFMNLIGLPRHEAKQIWKKAYFGLNTNQIDEKTFWERVETQLGRTLPDDKYNIWFKGIADGPWPEVITFAKELRDGGLQTAILSNSIRLISSKLRQDGTYDGFEPIIISDEVGLAKPDPAIYHLILDKMKLEPGECIFVDNVERNLVPAQQMGMTVVLADSNPRATVDKIKLILAE